MTTDSHKRFRITLTDIAFGGDCLGRLDNQVIFAKYGLPGEDVIVEITESRRDYQRGRVIEVIAPSPERALAPCPVFGKCGGCQWQHITYATQTQFKRKIVADQLRRLGGFGQDLKTNATLLAPSPWHYRNHVRLTAQNGRLGYNEEGTHSFLPVAECPIAHPAINQVLATLQGQLNPRLDHVTVRYGVNTGQLLIQPRIDARDLALDTGQEHLEEVLAGHKFRISDEAFFQINTPQGEQMARYVLDRLALEKSHTLADIYCGVGTFGLLAAGMAARVIGIEESPVALRDARHNAAGMKNVEFVVGSAEQMVASLKPRIDAVVLDPPRAGCKPEVVEALRRRHPFKIVYVSCDPATLARDLRLFCADGRYLITDVQPIDMFPQTYHIETIVTLEAS